MKTGMLWFDDDPKRTLEEKVERAAVRFREKYGITPDLCYANPHTVPDAERTVALKHSQSRGGTTKILMKQARSILPNHFWLGVASD